jgi:hypothetical protein
VVIVFLNVNVPVDLHILDVCLVVNVRYCVIVVNALFVLVY